MKKEEFILTKRGKFVEFHCRDLNHKVRCNLPYVYDMMQTLLDYYKEQNIDISYRINENH